MEIGTEVRHALMRHWESGVIQKFSPCGKYAMCAWQTDTGLKTHRVAKVKDLRPLADFTKKELVS